MTGKVVFYMLIYSPHEYYTFVLHSVHKNIMQPFLVTKRELLYHFTKEHMWRYI